MGKQQQQLKRIGQYDKITGMVKADNGRCLFILFALIAN